MRILTNLIDIILPPRCVFTGDHVDAQGTISPQIWASLNFLSDPLCRCCGFPFEFKVASGEEALCAACLKEKPVFTMARSALAYDEASKDFVLGFKHGDRMEAAVPMMPWLKMAGKDFWEQADVIVPVPLHRWRLLRRRYNQAAVMASYLGKSVSKTVCLDGLIRVRATPTQGHLKAKEREKNVRRAFAVNPCRSHMLKGKNIVLIDDVLTTGSTVTECAKELLNAGGSNVYVLTLARVVKPERF